ncbi:hypothetical protein B0H13DRAFT_2297648 [Mycena leptocephala]|nr:hypothetical protein B0H13DRAFT_2297648 [Mycena leptocephala]
MCLLSLCVVSPVRPSVRPEVRFVEPVTDVLHRDAHVESLADDREHDDALLMTVGEEDPYRPSPASPVPRRRRTRSLMSSSTSHCVFWLRRWRPRLRLRGVTPPCYPLKLWHLQPPALAREPPPPVVLAPAPPPVAKVLFKKWQSPRKLERANEEEVVCQSRGRGCSAEQGWWLRGGCSGG